MVTAQKHRQRPAKLGNVRVARTHHRLRQKKIRDRYSGIITWNRRPAGTTATSIFSMSDPEKKNICLRALETSEPIRHDESPETGTGAVVSRNSQNSSSAQNNRVPENVNPIKTIELDRMISSGAACRSLLRTNAENQKEPSHGPQSDFVVSTSVFSSSDSLKSHRRRSPLVRPSSLLA